MSVQVQLHEYRSTQSMNYSNSRYSAPSYGVNHVGLNSRQTSNPNPKVIPAPIPSNLVPYRKEESLKKMLEEDETNCNNPQFQKFLERRGKSAEIKQNSIFINLNHLRNNKMHYNTRRNCNYNLICTSNPITQTNKLRSRLLYHPLILVTRIMIVGT